MSNEVDVARLKSIKGTPEIGEHNATRQPRPTGHKNSAPLTQSDSPGNQSQRGNNAREKQSDRRKQEPDEIQNSTPPKSHKGKTDERVENKTLNRVAPPARKPDDNGDETRALNKAIPPGIKPDEAIIPKQGKIGKRALIASYSLFFCFGIKAL